MTWWYAYWNTEPWSTRVHEAMRLLEIPSTDFRWCDVPTDCRCKFHVRPRKKWRQFKSLMEKGYYKIGKVEAMTRKLQAMPHG